MRLLSSASARARALAVALTLTPLTAGAQLIGLRTVPLAAGEQFAIFPSRTLGMGGASIALDDELADPFANPSKGARLTEPRFFSVPTRYGVSDDYGAASTFPLGVLLTSERWFGGGVAAMQTLRAGTRFANRIPFRTDPDAVDLLPHPDALVERAPTNKYFQAMVGRRLGDGPLAVAASAFVADLNGTDGAEQLFADAWQIEEFGHVLDYRLGVTAELDDGRTLEAVVLHNRVSMTHDVTSVTEWIMTDSVTGTLVPEVAQEANLNKTRTWGLHLGYVAPMSDSAWRFGSILTANRKLHPKIPTYDLRAVEIPVRPPIPRDPGDSWAFQVGFGLAKEEGPTTFAVDVVYEPAWSYTWAEAEADVAKDGGGVIPAGGKTVENWFDFSNASADMGAAYRTEEVTWQLGLRVKTYDYRLRQEDRVRDSRRFQGEQWTRWTPTWGVQVAFTELELRYTGWASSASHFPFLSLGGEQRVFTPGAIVDDALSGSGDVLAPPTGELWVPDATTVTHRIGVSVPIR